MMSRLLSIILGVALLGQAAFAGNSCEVGSAQGPQTILELSCEIELQTLGCKDYFERNKIPKSKMRSCGETDSEAQEFLNSCGNGASGFFTAIYDGLAAASKKLSEEKQQREAYRKACEDDHSLTLKRTLEISARLKGVTKPVSDDELKNRSCESLLKAAEARDNFRQFQEYSSKLETPEFRSQWDGARKVAFADLKTKVVASAEKVGVVLQCYNHVAQTEIGCKIATALVTGVAVTRTLALSPASAAVQRLEISEADYAAAKTSAKASAWTKLSADEARAILGTDAASATDKVRRALAYVKGKKYPNAELKADDMETLFKDIHNNSFDWDYRRLPGSDGSTVFVGDAGYAVIIDPQGKIYKGLIDYKFYDSGKKWPADYSHLDSVTDGARP